MLAIFFIHIIITFTSLVTGFLFYNYIIRDYNYEGSGNYRPLILYLVTGLIILTLVTQLVILFVPATHLFQISLFSIIIFFILIARKRTGHFFSFLLSGYKIIPLPVKIIFAAVWMLLLLLNAGPVMMDDTDSYHIQMVKWIEEYGTVPGLANLHERYGFNSSWFSAIALFNFNIKDYNFYTSLNGVLSMWFAGYLLSFSTIFFKKDYAAHRNPFLIPYFIVFVFAFISWPVIRGNPSTANYDFVTLLVIFILSSEALRSLSEGEKFKGYYEWLIWPIFLFTVRIINSPFLILSLFSLISLLKQKKWKSIAVCSSICILLIIPFLIRNVIISGYLFYPSLYIDWFTVDWKADKQKTKQLLHFIKYYNRVATNIQSLDKTAALTFPSWVTEWFKYMFTYYKVLFIPGITGIILYPLILRELFSSAIIKILFLAFIVQITVWFISAPDPRFIYGILLVGILLLFSLFKNIFLLKPVIDIYRYVLFAGSFTITIFALNKLANNKHYQNWILPMSLPSPPTKKVNINNTIFNIPEKILNNWNSRCYATDLPCLYTIDSSLRMRGKTIKNGFKIEH